MWDHLTRRHLLAVSGGGLFSLAGCQSQLGSNVSLKVHVLNATEQHQDAYLELTRPDDDSFHFGRVLPIKSGVAESVSISVPEGTYQMMFNIDDVDPRPEKTVEWEVSEDDCPKEKFWTIIPADPRLDLHVLEANCEDPEMD